MPTFDTYDKLKWYFPDEIREIKYKSISALAKWLLDNDLVNERNKVSYKAPIDSDFRLIRDDLTPQGQALLDKYYKDWADSPAALDPIDLSVFENAIQKEGI